MILFKNYRRVIVLAFFMLIIGFYVQEMMLPFYLSDEIFYNEISFIEFNLFFYYHVNNDTILFIIILEFGLFALLVLEFSDIYKNIFERLEIIVVLQVGRVQALNYFIKKIITHISVIIVLYAATILVIYTSNLHVIDLMFLLIRFGLFFNVAIAILLLYKYFDNKIIAIIYGIVIYTSLIILQYTLLTQTILSMYVVFLIILVVYLFLAFSIIITVRNVYKRIDIV